ncbi:MAG: hypothetical protein ABH867_01110 [Patescibacteria group bacterium]|nr:hypothetical protein [Patescibacteria group bacterium]
MSQSQSRWLILIEEKEVITCLVTEDGSFFISKKRDWNGSEKDDLLAALDASLGECLSDSGLGEGPKEAVFVLSPFWIDDKGVVLGTRKQILKEVCQSLSVSPLGFLIGEEVLAQRFSSFVSVYFSQNHFRVSLVESGEIVSKEEVEGGLGMEFNDLVLVLKRVRGEGVLPEKLIFWGLIDQEAKKRLVGYRWNGEGLFESDPSVEVVSWGSLFNYFVEVVSGQGAALEEVEKITSEEKGDIEKKDKDNSDGAEEPDSELDFGFVTEDVAKIPTKKESSVLKESEEEEQPSLPVLAMTEKEPETSSGEKVTVSVVGDQAFPAASEAIAKPRPKGKKRPSFKFPKPALSYGKILWLFLIPIILLAGATAAWYFSSVKVEIFVTPEKISKEIEMKMDPSATELDSVGGVVPVENVEITLEGEKSASTTGQKLIGEKTIGKVTIYNRTAETKSFLAGTFLSGPGGLKFVLDDDVQIASKTADLVSGVDRWGETITAITANDIGAEYNLAAQSLFSVADFSEDKFLAKNSEALSEGTSRQVKAVSKNDRDNLKEVLTKELSAEAKKELEKEGSGGKILEQSLRSEVIGEVYSAEVAEEKENFRLTLELKFLVSRLSENNLLLLGKKVLEKEVPEGMVLDQDSIDAESRIDSVGEKGVVIGQLSVTGKAYPLIDKEELSLKLKLKNKSEAQKIIRSYSRVYRDQIVFQPSFFRFINFLPPKAENIIIEIKEK